MSQSVVPTIDCSGVQAPLDSVKDSGEFQTFTKELGAGLKDVGVVYLVNHGISQELIDSFFKKSQDFFALPAEVKNKYRKEDDTKNYHGYCHPEDEHFDEETVHTHLDFNEAWDTYGPDAKDPSKFPAEVPNFKDDIEGIRAHFDEWAKKILLSIGLALELEDSGFFLKNHSHLEDSSVETHGPIRSEHLFPIPASELEKEAGHLRQAAITSWGSLLFAIFAPGFHGLEIEKVNGEWVDAPIVENGILVNVGLLVESWTGGRLHAIRHRVRVEKDTADRGLYYGVYFLHADAHITDTDPLEGGHEDWNPKYPKHDGKTHVEYVWDRLHASRRPKKEK